MTTRTIVAIGGGPAGMEAARAGARAGAQVTMVSNAPIGGRAGWHSLLPSKVWLAAADMVGLVNGSETLGLARARATPNPPAILARITEIAEAWNGEQVAELRDLGVALVTGTASFVGENGVVVADGGEEVARLQANAFIIATGSVPRFPAGLKPDGRRIIAPRHAGHLDTLPGSIAVVGAGATGSEFVYLFNRLGVDVSWIVDEFGVLPGFYAPAGERLAAVLANRGVRLVRDRLAERIEHTDAGITVVTDDGARYEAGMAFVAVGRRADLDSLNLAAAGLETVQGRLEADAYMRTGNPHVYVVGDAAGMPMIANQAMNQAWVAARHAAGADTPPFNANAVVAATYTEPQVAQVGSLPGTPASDGGVATVRVPFSASLKARLMPEGDGFLELAYNRSDRRVVGAAAVGPHAADVLAPVVLAVQMNGTVDKLAATFAAHPTLNELAFLAAREIH